MPGPESITCVWVRWNVDSVLCDARGLYARRGDSALLRPGTAQLLADSGQCQMVDGEPGSFPGLGGRVLCVVEDPASSPDPPHSAQVPKVECKPRKGKR